ncbi:sulfurtransferase TusA family protein [Chengkuizengella sediminis]|uniref:sulfurtransferase TusA family protein n=1 Tax=Chengkuizengella sediminis TaxID=1885917 RepID=UPI001389C144|nr:sulfurtransferase TusA family protein [Chengkuizengella sediminis]NDI36912.1 sulfurtransferase TusA family protein [Chengkuizengella sediminis]
MGEVEVTKSVDARGSYCPGPLMELIKTIKTSNVGDIIEVISSDKGSAVDIPEWVNKMGHEVINTDQFGEEYKIIVKKMR